jgi:hypothetical protein
MKIEILNSEKSKDILLYIKLTEAAKKKSIHKILS